MPTQPIRSRQLNDLHASKVTAGVFDPARIPFIVPTGVVWPYAGSSAPDGFLLCDGGEYDPTDLDYVELFNVIGYTYGTGTNSPSNFKVPDMRGRVPAGVDGGTFTSRGTTVGSEDAIVVSHAHTASTSVNTGGGSHSHSGTFASSSHTHSVPRSFTENSPYGTGCVCGRIRVAGEAHTHTTGGPSSNSTIGSTNIDHSHTASTTVNSNGSSGTQANIQPSIALNYIISL